MPDLPEDPRGTQPDEWVQIEDLPEVIRPGSHARRLMVPAWPALPIAAAVCLLVGVSIGLALPSRSGEKSSAAAVASASLTPLPWPTEPIFICYEPPTPLPSPSPSPPPARVYGESPPPGLSLAQALKALEAAEAGSSGSVVFSEVARYGDVLPNEPLSESGAPGPQDWVWVFVVRGQFRPMICLDTCATASTMMVILDYKTGSFILDIVPSPI